MSRSCGFLKMYNFNITAFLVWFLYFFCCTLASHQAQSLPPSLLATFWWKPDLLMGPEVGSWRAGQDWDAVLAWPGKYLLLDSSKTCPLASYLLLLAPQTCAACTVMNSLTRKGTHLLRLWPYICKQYALCFQLSGAAWPPTSSDFVGLGCLEGKV